MSFTVSPVLFLVFNRPDTTARVFEAIRAARPLRLYVSADGARPGRVEEALRCEEVRRIATAVDWPCELFTLLQPKNLGCKFAPASAIDWFFDHEPEGIILEDDCLPDSSFFAYCDSLLARYRNDPRVMCVSGDNFVSSAWQPDASYYFSTYVPTWGWATWRRAWNTFDIDMSAWRAGNDRVLDDMFHNQPKARNHWKRIFDSVSFGTADAWDYQWLYACWSHRALSCIPRENLISNIGFGPGATHTTSAQSKFADIARGSLTLPLTHPEAIVPTLDADRWFNFHILGIDENTSRVTDWGQKLRNRLRPAMGR